MLSKRNQAFQKIKNIEPNLLCPHCGRSLFRRDNQIRCSNKHTFDLAKQGYLNLVPQHNENYYSKELFEARQKVMGEFKLYAGLYSLLLNILKEENICFDNMHILDLGSGEGSHFQYFYRQWSKSSPIKNSTFIGLDLAKYGVVTAAKYYRAPLWLVADLSRIPFRKHSIDGALSILSPANYKEIKRVLKKDTGWFIKIIPGKNYLKELRKVVFPNRQVENDSVVHFKRNFPNSYKQTNFYRKVSVDQNTLKLIIKMTPLMWHADEKITKQVLTSTNQVTIDLIILFSKNN